MQIAGALNYIGNITDFFPETELDGAYDIQTEVINGITYSFVTGFNDRGIQVLSLAEDGTLTEVDSVTDEATYGLYGASFLTTYTVGGDLYLVAAGYYDDALTVFEVDTDGTGTDGALSHVQTITDGTGTPPAALNGVYEIETMKIGTSTFVISAGSVDDGITVLRANNTSGELTVTDAALDADDVDYNLDGVRALATWQGGPNDLIFTGGEGGDFGISVFSLSAAGTLTNVHNTALANTDFWSLEVIEVEGQAYLIGLDRTGYEAWAFSIAANGSLTQVDTMAVYTDGLGYNNFGLDVFEIEGVPFISFSSDIDGLNLFSFNATEGFMSVEYVTDNATLDDSTVTRHVQVGDRHYLLVSSNDDDAVSVYEIAGESDPVVGTAGDDSIVGLNGDDDLLGLDGSDHIQAGNGNDVLSGGIGNDTLMGGDGDDALVGGNGADFLDGGDGADVLSGGLGRDTVSYESSSGAVIVNLGTGYNTGGAAEGDLVTSIEAVTGSTLADRIAGSLVDNRLEGGNGNDSLFGSAGDDTLSGGNGDDSILGGGGDDNLIGGNDKDTMSGAVGNDTLNGGAQNDLMLGAGGADVFLGGAGNDRMVTGAGNDTVTGGVGADVIVFADGTGDDVITDFDVTADRISFFGVSAINNFADVQAAAFTFSGDTVISFGLNSVLLEGVSKVQLSADDFLF